jgi:hypothetical protein
MMEAGLGDEEIFVTRNEEERIALRCDRRGKGPE